MKTIKKEIREFLEWDYDKKWELLAQPLVMILFIVFVIIGIKTGFIQMGC